MEDREHEALLCRIEQNNPTVTKLWIGDDARDGYHKISSGCSVDFFARLGGAIGSNPQLAELCFQRAPLNIIVVNDAFFDGLRRNSSIRKIGLQFTNEAFLTSGELAVKLLNCGIDLHELRVKDCTINRQRTQLLTSIIRRSIHLLSFHMRSTTGMRRHLPELMEAIGECRCLRMLHLSGYYVADELIGRGDCEALIAPLLQYQTGDLRDIRLGLNNVDSDCTNILARALEGNNLLTKLVLVGAVGDGNWSVGDFDVTPFKTLLCDTTTMDATYFSNHTLEHIWTSPGETQAEELTPFLELNRSSGDKGEVAIRKTLQYHPQFDVDPLFQWDMKVLPILVEWFERARLYPRIEGGMVDNRKLCAIFQFIRALPDVLFASARTGLKRKHNEMDGGTSTGNVAKDADTMRAIGNKHMKAKKYQHAHTAYTAALRISPTGPISHIIYANRAAALIFLRRYDEAVDDANQAIALKPAYGQGHSRLGQVLHFMKRYREAVEAYEEALKHETVDGKFIEMTRHNLQKAKAKLAKQEG